MDRSQENREPSGECLKRSTFLKRMYHIRKLCTQSDPVSRPASQRSRQRKCLAVWVPECPAQRLCNAGRLPTFLCKFQFRTEQAPWENLLGTGAGLSFPLLGMELDFSLTYSAQSSSRTHPQAPGGSYLPLTQALLKLVPPSLPIGEGRRQLSGPWLSRQDACQAGMKPWIHL